MLTEEQMRDALRQCPHDTVENLRVRWLYAKDFARAIESAATAPLLARIAELERHNNELVKRREFDVRDIKDSTAKLVALERELEEARKDAMNEAASICDRLDAEVDKYPAACAKAIREAVGGEAASQSDRLVLVPIEIDDCDEIVEAACNAGNLYRVDFIRAWQAAIRAAIKEQT